MCQAVTQVVCCHCSLCACDVSYDVSTIANVPVCCRCSLCACDVSYDMSLLPVCRCVESCTRLYLKRETPKNTNVDTFMLFVIVKSAEGVQCTLEFVCLCVELRGYRSSVSCRLVRHCL